MASLPIIYCDKFLQHRTGAFHPESPQRLSAIVGALRNVSWSNQLNWLEPKARNTLEYVQSVHLDPYINHLQAIAQRGGGALDEDTIISSESFDVAVLAVDAWLDGIDQVLQFSKPAFVLSRPPGHHARADQGMGFCLFSNAAIAATYALKQPNIKKVAILDWDVHHGNGTEEIIEDNPQIVYCSLHQYPAYPYTGKASDRGSYNNVLNIPLAPGSTFKQYKEAFDQQIMPFMSKFSPDLLIVSAGYDANYSDPLAQISLYPQDYGVLTNYCLQITQKILFGLEGGYDLDALAQSVLFTVKECLAEVQER